MYLTSFHRLIFHYLWILFFGERSSSKLCSIFSWIFFLLIKCSLCIDPLITYIIWKYFFQFGGLCFHSLKSVFQRAEVLKLMKSNFLFLLFMDSEFVSYLRYCLSQCHKDFSPIFSLKSFIYLVFLWPIAHFCVNLFYGVSYGSMILLLFWNFFAHIHPIFLAPFVAKIILSPLNNLCTLLKISCHFYLNLLLNSIFWFTDLFVLFYAITTLSWKLKLYSKHSCQVAFQICSYFAFPYEF